MELQKTKIFKFHRSDLIFGCERNLLAVVGLISMLLLILQTVVTTVIAAVIWFFGVPLLRIIAKNDANMSRVFISYKKYADYYPAHSRKDYSNKD